MKGKGIKDKGLSISKLAELCRKSYDKQGYMVAQHYYGAYRRKGGKKGFWKVVGYDK